MSIIALTLIILSSSTKNNDWVDEMYECPSSFINESEQDFISRSKKRGFLEIRHTNESKF